MIKDNIILFQVVSCKFSQGNMLTERAAGAWRYLSTEYANDCI